MGSRTLLLERRRADLDERRAHQAMTNTSCYIWSTAFFESRYGGAGKQRGWQGWQSTAESKLQPMLMRQCERSKLPGTGLYKLTEPSGGLHSTFKRGSSALFNHYLYLVKHMLPTAPAQQLHPFSNAIRAAVDVPAAAASAALEGRPVSYTTHAKMPGVMVHLAGMHWRLVAPRHHARARLVAPRGRSSGRSRDALAATERRAEARRLERRRRARSP